MYSHCAPSHVQGRPGHTPARQGQNPGHTRTKSGHIGTKFCLDLPVPIDRIRPMIKTGCRGSACVPARLPTLHLLQRPMYIHKQIPLSGMAPPPIKQGASTLPSRQPTSSIREIKKQKQPILQIGTSRKRRRPSTAHRPLLNIKQHFELAIALTAATLNFGTTRGVLHKPKSARRGDPVWSPA